MVRAATYASQQGTLEFQGASFPCALGKGGLSHSKREGDGTTPIGHYELLTGFYRADRERKPQSGLPFQALSPSDGWCDSPRHAHYNRPVRLPFARSHEVMWRDDCLYDIGVVLNHNQTPCVRGAGSAVFFHIAREGFAPTEGCIAVSKPDMRQILQSVRAGAVMVVLPPER
ncbi:L,D-transpeptidase family protein [Polycladidibacter hongkongensis]|uniref:L,D-transpeptidase family protein n=1 Tax=Polycladidibacter hongkongensis TaxID=1647556 RepID=UPI000830D825|nr:L,D-transpeptidase family protein [Pseudovibrio hongkongensis]